MSMQITLGYTLCATLSLTSLCDQHLRLHQPRHLPHRPRPPLPPGVPRHHHRRQHIRLSAHDDHRLSGGPRLGPVTSWGTPDTRVLVPLLARRCRSDLPGLG